MLNERSEKRTKAALHDAPAEPIAIVGMAVDFPGAPSVKTFWENLREGVESITAVSEEALLAAGETPDRIHQKNYVAAAARLDGFDHFDADFFGFSAKEAAILDPQHRKFIEVAYSSLENAGHPPERFDGAIGVYAGCGMGSYFYFNLCSNPDLVDDVGMFLLRHTGNDKDFLATRVSHILDLKGPSVNIQTACSTSLVAAHYACDALRRGECDMALAGGVTIELPQGRGYLFKENEILSPDGHCHAFDHRAQGTVFGSGAGCVVLRRLSDALADGDHIWGVIRGSAINNDGADKASYLAPSVDGQASAVATALDAAGVQAGSVDYVECHGTGTSLGDPIEVSALTEAFRQTTDESGFCRIGSVKSNIGHLDTAAGVAGLVKTALSLHHKQLPPSLGYEAANPAIDFDSSPFRVNDTLRPWDRHQTPRRAGVNALGVGGTNAHMVLEEAPERGTSEDSDWPFHVLCISGRSKGALDDNAAALATHLRANPDQPLADIAFTLKNGRRAFDKRRVVVAETHAEAAALLESGDKRRVFTHDRQGPNPDVVFMFPGGGAQYPDMARDLYETEPVFAQWMDRGLDHLQPKLDYDIRALWLPEPAARAEAEQRLNQPSAQLPLIMILEYALAQLWMSWGVHPKALVGHSMGENTAACLAGVISFEDCIDLVQLRAQLFDTVPQGGMLSVSLPIEQLERLVGDNLDIASVNAPELCAVSGPQDRLDRFAAELDKRQIDYRRIAIDIAAHSRMLDPILDQVRSFLAGLDLHAPQIPIVSNRTGTLMTAQQATDPDYWVSQLRHRVEFGACIRTLAKSDGQVFLEVGPGKALSSLAPMNEGVQTGQVLSSLRHPDQDVADDAYFLGVIGRLWACGVEADWQQIWGEARRLRVPLPTYAFQRKRYFIEPRVGAVATAPAALLRKPDMADWAYRPVWHPRYANSDLTDDMTLDQAAPKNWLLFMDAVGLAEQTAERLEAAGHKVVRVHSGDLTERRGDGSYSLAPEMGQPAYDRLFEYLSEHGEMPDRVAHFWLVTEAESFRPGSSFVDRNLEHGFFSLMHLAQALGNVEMPGPLHVTVLTNGAEQVRAEGLAYPEKAIIAGPAGVIPRELPGISIATLDIELAWNDADRKRRLFGRASAKTAVDDTLVTRLLDDLLALPGNSSAAFRGEKRLEKSYARVDMPQVDVPETHDAITGFREGGTYLITGGFGGLGLSVAGDLLKTFGANVVLLSRNAIPPPDQWDDYLAGHAASDQTATRIRAVRALKRLGGRVVVAVADVCNRAAMEQAKKTIEDQLGPISGVIHAAGIIDDAPLLTKTVADVERVFAPKITGLRVLDTLFPDGTLELMVLFASSSTATRPAGQIDYAAANSYFNAFAQSRKSAKTRVVAVNWGVWAQVGMAADAMSQRAGNAERQDWAAAGKPLLDDYRHRAGQSIFRTKLSADRHWVIDGHRTSAGDALLPGTGYIELAAQAAAATGLDAPFEIRDLHFLRPLDVADGQTRRIEVRLDANRDGLAFEARSACQSGARTGTVAHASASLIRIDATVDQIIDTGAILARSKTRRQAPSGERLLSPQEAHLNFGPRWHVLQDIALGDGEGIARLALPDSCRADLTDGYLLHPGLLDLATGWAMELVPGYDTAYLWVPLMYQSIRVLRQLPAEIFSWARLSDSSSQADGFASFDITLCDANGIPCVEIAEFQMKRLDHALRLGEAASILPGEIDFDDTANPQGLSLSADEARLHHNISQGIRPEDGPEALRRALRLGMSQVVISSLDLQGLIDQADEKDSATDSATQNFERPDLDGDYLAPRTETEATLAGFWQDLLGVSPIGVEDSFFDLGGHSLIAVRLFALIKRRFDVQFPISVLFEAPTIATCAALIEDRTGQTAAPADSADKATPKTPTTRGKGHTYLVPLNRPEGATKPPFFLVAGMGGNVLNLRHVAQHLGPDQPVYGVQAGGLIGDDKPHFTTEEAAADYIAEIRQVQPKGPYLLGGFSGGGITAYEVAQQLKAAGESIAILALLDTPIPVRPPLNRLDKGLIKLHEFRRKGPRYLGEWLSSRLRWEFEKRQTFDDTGAIGLFNNHKVEMAFRQAVGQYQLRPWSGRLLLFRPPLDRHWPVAGNRWVSRAREYVFDDNQWTDWAPNIEVIEVTGDHDSMVLEPNVSVLAAHLGAQIAMAAEHKFPSTRQEHAWPIATAAE